MEYNKNSGIVTITGTPYKAELYELAPDLFTAAKNILWQTWEGNIEDIDFSRLEQVIEKIQTA